MKQSMNIPALNKLQIFTHQLENGKQLLYAPLSGCVVEAEGDEVALLEQKALGKVEDDVITALCDSEATVSRVAYPDTITELTILLNQRCNFSCSYCYSANGRDNKEIDLEQLMKIIDWFVSPERGAELELVFSGGGDPMLSFGLLRQGVEYAVKKSDDCGVKLNIGVVTNGSTLLDEQIEFVKKYNIGLVVSFDIIESVHNKQRSHYSIVAATISKLCDKGVSFGIRSTITPLNAPLQEQMVEELHHKFPLVKSAAFECVLNKDLFATEKELEQFYINFEEHLFAAQALGESYGITIGNTIINNIDNCKERACLGKLVATPYGYITACSRISSHKEQYFDKFVYGEISKEKIVINKERIDDLMSKTVESYSDCSSCIAKWHCSGGCQLARHSLPTGYFECYCRFMRRLVVRTLLNKINE